jgi:type II secretory pathway pseudopilin PulG
MQLRRQQRGDTLIEVLFAISIFSMVVVGSIAIMNVGSAAAARTLGLTVTRQVIDMQAQMLRLAHDSYVAQYPAATYAGAGAAYDTIETTLTTSKASNDIVGLTTCPTTFAGNVFTLSTGTTGGVTTLVAHKLLGNTTPTTYPQTVDGSGNSSPQGVWVEAVKQPINMTSNPKVPVGYIDFHINACWPGPGGNIPLTIGTIVRLYDPSN